MYKEFRQRTADGKKGLPIYIDPGHGPVVVAVQVGKTQHCDVYLCGARVSFPLFEDALTVKQQLELKR